MSFNLGKSVNLTDKNSLGRIIIYLLSGGILNYSILFFTSVLIFRNVDRSDYALYVILIAVFAILELFLGGYNQAIARYLKEKISLEEKQKIVIYTFYYKYISILIFIFLIFFLKNYGLFEYLIKDYKLVEDIIDNFLVIAIFNSIISAMIGMSNTILNSLYQYRFVTTIDILRNLLYLLSVIVIIFITEEYLVYLYTSSFINVVFLIILSVKTSKNHKAYSFLTLIRIKPEVSIYKKYLFSYATPLTAISLLTYVKNQLPIIILGKEFELQNVAIFSIIKNFFKAVHSLTSSFLGSLISKFITLKEHKRKLIIVMNGIYYGFFTIRLFIYITLIFLIEYFFILYKLNDTDVNRLIFYILGFEFIIAGMMVSYSVLLNLRKTTVHTLYISLGRFTVEIILIYFLLFEYGVLAAALILLLSRYFETFVAYFFINNEKVFKFTFLTIILAIPCVMYFVSEALN